MDACTLDHSHHSHHSSGGWVPLLGPQHLLSPCVHHSNLPDGWNYLRFPIRTREGVSCKQQKMITKQTKQCFLQVWAAGVKISVYYFKPQDKISWFCCMQKVVQVQYIQSDKWSSTKMSVLLIFLQMHRCSLVPSGSYKNPLCFQRAHRKGQLHPRCCMLMRGLFVRSLCLETRWLVTAAAVGL